MGLAEQLRELQDLYQSGALNEQEYARAKELVLSGASSDKETRLQEQLGDLQRASTLARLDAAWQMEREAYMISGKHGHRYLPTKGMSLFGGIMVVGFGIFWTIMAFSITSGIREFGFANIFPLFGLFFICLGVGMSIYTYNKAIAYEQALVQYQARREALLRGESHETEPTSPPTEEDRFYRT